MLRVGYGLENTGFIAVYHCFRYNLFGGFFVLFICKGVFL